MSAKEADAEVMLTQGAINVEEAHRECMWETSKRREALMLTLVYGVWMGVMQRRGGITHQ